MVCLAVDGMGGDYAPSSVFEGLSLFHSRCPKASFIVYGDEKVLLPLLKIYPSLFKACEVVHTEETISPHAKPSQALRQWPLSSMRLTLEAVASHKAQGAVSAGNTGAYLALSKMILKTCKGIDRPAIASQIPTEKGESVMIDLGATLDVSWRNLAEYALMGDVFARKVLDIPSPSLGLLNVGKEETKGNTVLQQAFGIMKEMFPHFKGFIEGDDIPLGTVSIIVTDGFTGNVALKTAEGTARLFFSSLKKCLGASFYGQCVGWLARPFLKELHTHFDPRVYNGALWLGLTGVAVKSHGSADGVAFSHALEMAYDMVQANITHAIEEALKTYTLFSSSS